MIDGRSDRPSTAKSFEIYRCSLIALIFNSCSMIFQRSTAGASTIEGQSFEMYWVSLIFNDFQWVSMICIAFHCFALMFNDVQWLFNDFSLCFIVFHWLSMMFNDFSMVFRSDRPSTAKSFEIYWCVIDIHWFSNRCSAGFFNDRRPERSKLIDGHWASMIFNDCQWFLLLFIDLHWFSMMFNDCSMIFIAFHCFPLTFNDVQWLFNERRPIDGQELWNL